MPHATRRTRILGTAASLAALIVSVAGCSSGDSSDGARPSAAASPTASVSAAPTTAAPRTYVALGDSYTAGPGITPQQADSGMCQRSTKNWPTRLAASVDLTLRDLSCSGATTSDLSATSASGTMPRDAALVTVSAGGNDGGLFLSLIQACRAGAEPCRAYVDDRAPAILGTTTADLARLLTQVRRAAPEARVLLVGYPRIMPASGTCPAAGIPAADTSSVVKAESSLDTALEKAASTAGVDYVSLRDASLGHDACAGDQAWTNGVAPRADDGIVFHPNARGMAAVADIVAAAAR
jgi:lysophospholipase L1-like esterase